MATQTAIFANRIVHATDPDAPKRAQCPSCGRAVRLTLSAPTWHETERGVNARPFYVHVAEDEPLGCPLHAGTLAAENQGGGT
jgi:hypothetical protein